MGGAAVAGVDDRGREAQIRAEGEKMRRTSSHEMESKVGSNVCSKNQKKRQRTTRGMVRVYYQLRLSLLQPQGHHDQAVEENLLTHLKFNFSHIT